jgi:K+-transporting ATPase ATPase C chain
MRSMFRNALMLFLLMTVITGVVYPLVVTGAAQLLFPAQANGSLVLREGRPVASRLIGQPFTDPGYFWGRPSATAPQPNNGMASGGSNLGPTNASLTAAAGKRIADLRAADPGNTAPVPVELATASGSGLDPEISPAAANYQVARVARVRQLSTAQVQALVARATSDRQFGVLGEPRVNVLALNALLDGR